MRVLALNLAVLLIAWPAWGGVFHVNRAAAPGGDGASWATALQTIQPAIDAAFADGGGEVWVAAGVYDEVRDPATGALLLREGVSLYGGFAGGETQHYDRDFTANPVTITGERSRGGLRGGTVMKMESHTLVDGFSIVGAQNLGILALECENVTISNVTFRGRPDRNMSGLLGNGSNFSINHCKFIELPSGAANLQLSDSTIYASDFISNSGSNAGGIFARRLDRVQIEGCIFLNNSTISDGGAITFYVRGMDTCVLPDQYPQVKNCLFIGNSAARYGGAVYASFLVLEKGDAHPFGGNGSVDSCYECPYCTRSGYYFPVPILSGCTFVDNTSPRGGGAVYGTEQVPGANCIFYNNSEPAVSPTNVHLDYEVLGGFVYSNLQVCDGGEGNICGDPLFVDAANGDYRLRRDSPGVDAGRNTNTEFYGMAGLDFSGNSRGYHARAGSHGDGSNFDMGAYEWTDSYHDGDQNRDGLIDFYELLRVIEYYNATRYGCEVSTEDGFAPEAVNESCPPHTGDYNPQDWRFSLRELLRMIQLYHYEGHYPCEDGEDGYCVESGVVRRSAIAGFGATSDAD